MEWSLVFMDSRCPNVLGVKCDKLKVGRSPISKGRLSGTGN